MLANIQETVLTDETPVKATDNEQYDFHQELTQITTELLGKMMIGGVRKKSTPYWTQKLKKAVHAKNLAFGSWMKHQTAELWKEYVKKGTWSTLVDGSQKRSAG